jgi:lipopolysaccharide cholinephosphotransferase
VDVPFEGCTLKAPAAYDQVLRRLYGDYMKLPPEEDRIGHHFYRTYKK